MFTYDNSKLTPLGKLELLAETTTGYHLLTFHILRDSQIPRKPLLLSGLDCVKLGLVKICADEVHSVSSPLSTVNGQKPHLMADNCRRRDIPMQPGPTSPPRVSDVSNPNTTWQPRPPTLAVKWVLDAFQDVHTGPGQLGRPDTFDMDPTVIPVHDPIHHQLAARHSKIKLQLDKMESEGKISRQYEPTAWCSNVTVRETKDKFRICLDP